MKSIAYFLMWIANKIMAKSKDISWQRRQEMECAKNGHIWTKFDNDSNMSKTIKKRTYCRRCGQMYHEHEYIGTQY